MLGMLPPVAIIHRVGCGALNLPARVASEKVGHQYAARVIGEIGPAALDGRRGSHRAGASTEKALDEDSAHRALRRLLRCRALHCHFGNRTILDGRRRGSGRRLPCHHAC
ncbi:protein of unknown function [Micropruina glycogenica]|uniref:Uncharacterized protein n=1 Tax=Micropruina glycogenica TaxID=75385 RepID=A0A2N9JAA9_9ACTN|nr:protein of unknown function [Micropruina glycogenica]